MTGVNTLHRRHWKSGSCLSQHPLEEYVPTGKRFFQMLRLAEDDARDKRRRGLIEGMFRRRNTAPAIDNTPRTTRSLFGKVASKLAGIFRGKVA